MVPPDMVAPYMVAPNTVAPYMAAQNMVSPNSRFNFFGHIHKFKVRTLVESVASLHSLLASIKYDFSFVNSKILPLFKKTQKC